MRDITLLEDVEATDNGTWVPAHDLISVAIQVTGITTGTVKICVSLATTKPLNTVHDSPIGEEFTANGSMVIGARFNWIKAYISAWTAGAISVEAKGLQPIDVGKQVIDE